MKICLVAPSFYPAVTFGGPTVSKLNKCKFLVELVHQVFVSTTNSNNTSKLEVETGTYKKIEKNIYAKYYNEIVLNRFSLDFLLNIYNDIKRCKMVIIDDLFSSYSLISLYISVIQKKKFIIIPRGVLSDWSLKNRNSLFKKLWIYLLIWPIQKKINWEVTSNIEFDQVKYFFQNSKIIKIPNGIDIELYNDVRKLSIDEYDLKFIGKTIKHKKILVSMGRLHPVKRYDRLIIAFSKIYNENKNLILLIAGDDWGAKKDLIDLTIKLKVDSSVKFVGHLDFINKVEFLKGADLFILLSESENFGNVVLEALVCETKVVLGKELPWNFLEENKCGHKIDTDEDLVFCLKTIINQKSNHNTCNFANYVKEYDKIEIIKLTEKEYNNIIK